MFRAFVASVALLALFTTVADARRRDQVPDEKPIVQTLPTIWTSDDVKKAIALAEDKDFPDDAGAKCWKIWLPAALILERNRLPLVARTAADLQAKRYVDMRRKQLTANPECRQMAERVNDALAPLENVVSARRPYNNW